MNTTTTTHTYEPIIAEEGPQDPECDGTGLTFETLEQGGGPQAAMPMAIKVTDAEGRWCLYEPTHVNGQLVRSLGYMTTTAPNDCDNCVHLKPTPKEEVCLTCRDFKNWAPKTHQRPA